MKHPIKFYARALIEALKSPGAKIREAEIMENFVALLKKNGDLSRAKKILGGAEDEILREKGGKKIVIESARPIRENLKKLVHDIAEDGDEVQEIINNGIIAGIKITINGERQLDYSLARKIGKLFT